jgi:hypothetical protein
LEVSLDLADYVMCAEYESVLQLHGFVDLFGHYGDVAVVKSQHVHMHKSYVASQNELVSLKLCFYLVLGLAGGS